MSETLSTTKISSSVAEHDAIVSVMNQYSEAVRSGKSGVMKSAFHPNCTFFGFYRNELLAGPIQQLFDWVDGNGPSPSLNLRLASIEVHGTIACVRVEMEGLTGKLSDPGGTTLTDFFQLIHINGEWKISQKSFHWH